MNVPNEKVLIYNCPMQHTTSLYDRFMDQGYLVVEDLISPPDIRALRLDYHRLLDRLTKDWVVQNKIPSTFEDLSFDRRMAAVLGSARENLFGYFDISLPNKNISSETPIHLSRPIFDLIRNPRILDVIEALIGEEILASPIQHVRIKPPRTELHNRDQQSSLVKATGWHQDQGVAREESDETEMVTVWIAITDATVENGCLQVIPFSHRDGIETHCPAGGQMVIPETLLNGEPKPIPLKAGSALLLHRRTKHASLVNQTDSIRWSFDLRYQPLGQPTGRDELPGLVVRSRKHPNWVENEYENWVKSWQDAKMELAAHGYRSKTHRWDGAASACA